MTAALDEAMPGRHASGHHELAFALLASLALHAMLLLGLPAPRISALRPPLDSVLTAYLAPARAAPAIVSRSVAPPPAPALRGPRRALERRPAPARALRFAARPADLAQVRSTPASRGAEQTASAAPAAAPALPVAAVPAPRATAAPASEDAGRAQPAPPRSAADRASALARYRLALIAEAQRYRRYPRLALDNDWRGKVEVRMAVAASGALASLSVGRGSGHAVLDRQALDMIRKAKPRAAIPAALRGREFTLDIPVIFALREPSA